MYNPDKDIQLEHLGMINDPNQSSDPISVDIKSYNNDPPKLSMLRIGKDKHGGERFASVGRMSMKEMLDFNNLLNDQSEKLKKYSEGGSSNKSVKIITKKKEG